MSNITKEQIEAAQTAWDALPAEEKTDTNPRPTLYNLP